MSKATRPGIARVSVKQYAEITGRSTQRVNKLLQDLETIDRQIEDRITQIENNLNP